MNPSSAQIEALCSAFPDLDWSASAAQIKRKSMDYYWFSPVLRRQLEGKLADAVVRPRNTEELAKVVAACARTNLPLTIRGGGTGNYGQAVPLEGGVVIDMTGCDQIVWVKNRIARAQAGIKLGALEDFLAAHQCELRCMPSTYRMATLGGLFCGGFGGIGSITYGPLSAPGTVLGIKVMTVETEPRLIELRSPEAMQHAHTYGTNGIVLELEVALAPASEWDEYLLCFPNLNSAFACGQALAQGPGIVKREVAVFADTVVEYFKKLASFVKPSEHAVIAVIAPSSFEAMTTLIASHGGRIACQQTGAIAKSAQHTFLEYCWNHTTLHALRGDKSLTYLQTNYGYARELEQLSLIDKEAGGEMLNHLEFIQDEMGRVVCCGLPLVRFTSESRLQELIELHRDCGIVVNNPHIYTLEDGRHRGSMSPRILEAKRRFDPAGLLNPGKVRPVFP